MATSCRQCVTSVADSARIREARAEDAATLTELAVRSKGHWGYPREFLDACREELTLRSECFGTPGSCYRVAESDGSVVGFHGLERLSRDQWELAAMFVEPASIGCGFGRLLIEDAKRCVISAGAKELLIQGDPHAAGFYRAAGGVEIGRRESGSIPNRCLPLFSIRFAAVA